MRSKKSLTSFPLLGPGLNVWQADVAGLVLDQQHAEDRHHHAGQARDGERGPPAVALGHKRGDDGAQPSCQVHAA